MAKKNQKKKLQTPKCRRQEQNLENMLNGIKDKHNKKIALKLKKQERIFFGNFLSSYFLYNIFKNFY